jgi:hypothetical protein
MKHVGKNHEKTPFHYIWVWKSSGQHDPRGGNREVEILRQRSCVRVSACLILSAISPPADGATTQPQPPARWVHWGHQHWATSRTRHSTPAAQAQPAAGRRAPAETGAKHIPEGPSSGCKGRRDHRGIQCISVQSRSGLGAGRCLRKFGGGRPGRPEDQKYLEN